MDMENDECYLRMANRIGVLAWCVLVSTTVHAQMDDFRVSLASGEASGAGSVATGGSATAVPVLSVGDADAGETDGMVDFEVTLDAASADEVRVDFATTGIEADAQDYVAAAGTLTFPAGTTERTIGVSLIDDELDEHAETFTLDLSNPAGATLGDGSATGTIHDDDPLTRLGIYSDRGSVEGGTSRIPVLLDEPSGRIVTVDYDTAHFARPRVYSAEAGVDFERASGTLTFAPGETTRIVSVALPDDSVFEGWELFVVRIFNLQHAEIRFPAHVWDREYVLIQDNETVPTVTIADTLGLESDGELEFGVTLSGPVEGSVEMSYSTRDGTALAGEDYTAVDGTLSFASLETGSAIRVAVANDDVAETTETLSVHLSQSSGRLLDEVPDQMATGTIQDDDGAAALSIGGAVVGEGDASVDVVVVLGGTPGGAVTVNYATEDGSATDGNDYRETTGTLSFALGETRKTIRIDVIGDDIDEDDETFVVMLSGEVGATLSTSSGRVTIQDDDDMPLMTIHGSEGTEGGELVYVVSLSPASGRAVSVRYATDTGLVPRPPPALPLADDGSDYERQSGALEFEPGETAKTIRIALIEDVDDEPAETVVITLTHPVNVGFEPRRSSDVCPWSGCDEHACCDCGVIVDNDLATLSIGDASGREGAADLAFAVRLAAVTDVTATVAYATRDVTAVAGEDYEASQGSLTFEVGTVVRTVFVSPQDDDRVEQTEAFAVSLSNPVGATLGDDTGTGTILDDDTRTVSVDDGGAVEGAGEMRFAVRLDKPLGTVVTVDYHTNNTDAGAAAATPDVDYESTVGTATFAAGETVLTVTVSLLDDELDELDEEFLVKLTNPSSLVSLDDDVAKGTIRDDDGQPGLAIADGAGPEDIGRMPFTLTLSEASGREVTAAYATADGTARAGSDYRASSGTVTFAAGETALTVRVAVTDDSVDEPDETILVNLTSVQGARELDLQARGTIRDDDAPPRLSVADAQGGERLGGLAFGLTLTTASGREVVVGYASSDGTAKAGSDYSQVSGSVTFAAGQTSRTVRVPIVDDSLDEPNETLALTLSGPLNAVLGDAAATGTILDDDAPPSLSVGDASGREDIGMLVFTATMDATSGRRVAVDYSTSDGSARAGSDYRSVSGRLTFAPAELRKAITVAIVDDTEVENALETFTLTLANPSNADLADAEATGTIQDDDTRSVTLAVSDAVAFESDGTLAFDVTLGGEATEAVTADYRTVAVTATAGADYVETSGSLRFEPGETRKTIRVDMVDDYLSEGSETLRVELSNSSGAALGGPGTGTILDDDAAPQLSVADASGIEDVGRMAFRVTLSAPSGVATTVRYATMNVTANDGTDYVGVAGVLTFDPGETVRTIGVAIVDDHVEEPEESFSVELSTPAGATLARGSGVGTIVDDDTPPSVSIAGASALEGVGELAFPVTLDMPGRVAVGYSTVEGTARSELDYRPVSGTLTFAPGETARTIRVLLVDDLLHEPDEAFTVVLTDPVDARLAVSEAVGGILDDDAVVAVSIRGATVDEGGGPLVFPATLDGPSPVPVTVDYATADGSAVAGGDYDAATGTLTFAPNETVGSIVVEVHDDDIDESDEDIRVALSAAVGATLDLDTAVGVIVDDDAPPAMSVVDAEGPENVGELAFSVTLDHPSASTVTVGFSSADATATADGDYRATSGTLTFAPGETMGTIRVAVLDDVFDEPDETFRVVLANPNGGTLADASGVGTIRDDDESPTLSVGDDAGPEDGGELTFRVSLDMSSLRQVVVDYATMDATATAGIDYQPVVGTLTFAPGETATTVRVVLIDDQLDEPDETLSVGLSNPVFATLGRETGTGTITDDDEPPVAVDRLPDVLLCVGGDPQSVDLTLYFQGGPLRYSAESSDPDVATVTLDGNALRVAPGSEGEATVTVAVSNEAGTTSGTFRVTVVSDPAEQAALDRSFALMGNHLLGDVVAAVGTRFGSDRRSATMAGPRSPTPVAFGGGRLPAPRGNLGVGGSRGSDRARTPRAVTEWGVLVGSGPSGGDQHGPRTRLPPAFALESDDSSGDRTWSVWGHGGTRRFSEAGDLTGSSEGDLDGSLSAFHLGIDTRRGDWRVGIAVSVSEAETDYRYERSVAACTDGDGVAAIDVVAVQPYAGRHLDGGGSLWAVVGMGRGEAFVERCETSREVADLDVGLLAAGGRHPLVLGERWLLSLVQDIGVIRLETGEATGPVGERSLSAGRARIGLEASWRPTDSFESFVRTMARGDWNEEDTEAALDMSVGARFRNPGARLGFDFGIWMLAAPSGDERREHGANVSLSLLPKSDGTGLSFALSSRLGDPKRSSMERSVHPFGGVPGGPGRAGLLDARVSYGVAVPRLGGTMGPYVELDIARDSGVAGLRFQTARASPLGLELVAGLDSRRGYRVRVVGEMRF